MNQLNVVPGTNITFMVVATGGNLAYQWQQNGGNLTDGVKYSGSTTATLTVMNVMEEDEGNFMCVVTNVQGSVNSSAAKLTVLGKCVCTCVVCMHVCMCACEIAVNPHLPVTPLQLMRPDIGSNVFLHSS